MKKELIKIKVGEKECFAELLFCENEECKDFDTANVIKEFYYRDDLWNFIKANPISI